MKIRLLLLSILVLIFFSGCETIKKKSDEIAEKENERLSQFIGKQSSELKIELGVPTEDFINEVGNETLIYKVSFSLNISPIHNQNARS